MTRFSIRVEAILDIDSCEHILAINRWIKDSVSAAGVTCEKYTFQASFFIGDLHVDCDDETEFKEHAFGQEIRMYEYYLTAYTSEGLRIAFAICQKRRETKNISISCKDKHILADIVSSLKCAKENYDKEHTTVNNVNINVEHSQVGAITVGNNNQIEAKVEHKSVTGEPQTDSKSSFWQNIWQTVVSNALWVILVSLVLLILVYLGIAKPDWLAL